MNKTPEALSEEQILLNKATDWVISQLKGKDCPFCPWVPADGASGDALSNHLKSKHTFKTVLAWQQKDLDPLMQTLSDEELHEKPIQEALGIEMQDELDRPDYLFIPPAMKREVAAENGKLYWVTRDKVEQHKAEGAVVMERKDYDMPYQASTEDTTVRANELILVKYPEKVWQRRKKMKDAKADNQLVARAEQLRQNADKQERYYYDTLVRKGYDREQARQVARALARGKERGDWKYGSPDAHRGIEVRDRHGAHNY